MEHARVVKIEEIGFDFELSLKELAVLMRTGDPVTKSTRESQYFHGFIPRDELPSILKEIGDFIVRVSHPDVEDRLQTVISIRTSRDDSNDSIRHFVVHGNEKSGINDWYVSQKYTYKSLNELIKDYAQKERPICPEMATSVLKHGIGRQSWELLHKDITLKKEIGCGEFGEVYEGELRIDNRKHEVAVKLEKQSADVTKKERMKEVRKQMINEVRIMRRFQNEHVVGVFGMAIFERPIMIVMELVRGGSLLDALLQRRGSITENEKIRNMGLGTALGLAYLHAHRCIHRDIAARNVLYSDSKVAKITDFGLSRIGEVYTMKRGMKKLPLKWMAPECIILHVFTPKSDVYAYGVLLWEIFSEGAEPFEGITPLEVRRMILCGERMRRPEKCSTRVFEIIKKCWKDDPESRYTMRQIVKVLEGMCDTAKDDESKFSPDSLESASSINLEESRRRASRTRTTSEVTRTPTRKKPTGPVSEYSLPTSRNDDVTDRTSSRRRRRPKSTGDQPRSTVRGRQRNKHLA